MTPGLYARLDLLHDATPEQVKAAYRRKSKETHPDSGGGDAEAFRLVQAAYDVLGDPERRAKYDSTGETGAKGDIGRKAAEALSQLFVIIMTQELCVPARDNLVDIARRKLGQAKEESALKHQRARKEAAKLRDAGLAVHGGGRRGEPASGGSGEPGGGAGQARGGAGRGVRGGRGGARAAGSVQLPDGHGGWRRVTAKALFYLLNKPNKGRKQQWSKT